MTIQHAFTKPGEYYFLTNGTEEVIGDLASPDANRPKNAEENYFGYHDGFQITPSQVLATVTVNGDELNKKPEQPEAWAISRSIASMQPDFAKRIARKM